MDKNLTSIDFKVFLGKSPYPRSGDILQTKQNDFYANNGFSEIDFLSDIDKFCMQQVISIMFHSQDLARLLIDKIISSSIIDMYDFAMYLLYEKHVILVNMYKN